MTLELKCGMEIKVGFTNRVGLKTPEGERIETDIEDILDAAYYVLTNTDLEENDPRVGFLKVLGGMKEVPGYDTLHMLDPTSSPTSVARLDYRRGWSIFPPK